MILSINHCPFCNNSLKSEQGDANVLVYYCTHCKDKMVNTRYKIYSYPKPNDKSIFAFSIIIDNIIVFYNNNTKNLEYICEQTNWKYVNIKNDVSLFINDNIDEVTIIEDIKNGILFA